MNHHFFLVLTLLSTLVLGRAARADEIDSRGEYIVNGSPTEAIDLRGTVALLFAPEAEGPEDLPRETLSTQVRCSAVLISPSVAVTAAHCVEVCGYEACESDDGETFECYRCEPKPRPANSLFVAGGLRTLDDVWSAEIKAVRELIVHEGYLPSAQWLIDLGACVSGRENELICEKPGLAADLHDIALLMLEAPMTAVNPVPLLDSGDDLAGEMGTAQGYGMRAPPEYEGLLDQPQYFSLLNQTTTPIEQATEQEILTAEGTNRSGGCFGDSGGPLYIQRGNELFVAGFLSRFRLDVEHPLSAVLARFTPPRLPTWIGSTTRLPKRFPVVGVVPLRQTRRPRTESG